MVYCVCEKDYEPRRGPRHERRRGRQLEQNGPIRRVARSVRAGRARCTGTRGARGASGDELPGVRDCAGRGALAGEPIGVYRAGGGAVGHAARAADEDCARGSGAGSATFRHGGCWQDRSALLDVGRCSGAVGGGDLYLVRREAAILSDPASAKILLAGGQPGTTALQASWHAKLGIVVSGQKIPPPANGRVLQLWLIPKAPGGKPLPSQVVRPDADGNFVLLVPNPPEVMAETKALAVTEEPAGGSPQPTTTPKWVGGVS